MRDINKIDLRLVDTTILLVFLGTMRHRKATAVAAEMGLTTVADGVCALRPWAAGGWCQKNICDLIKL